MKRLMSMALLCAAVVVGGAFSASAQTKPIVHASGGVFYIKNCGDAQPAPGMASCHSTTVTDSAGNPMGLNAPTSGYLTPSQLRAAYGVTAIGSPSTTIGIVDAYGYNNAEADMNAYRAYYGLPPCTTANGCFKKVNQSGQQGGYPAQDLGWASETALDLDMVSAMCPNCHIILVEASTPADFNLSASVNTAVRLGANVVSNSYGGQETNSQPFEANYNHPGVPITASTGDNGFGVQFPASSPHVIAVGGTKLVKAPGTARGWTETAWGGSGTSGGAGAGCSTVYAKPVWQTDPLCTMRMVADVSAVADPFSSVSIYITTWSNNKGVYGGFWAGSGGTSVAAPLVAGIIGAQGNPRGLGAGASSIYAAWTANNAILNDVISGNDVIPPATPTTACGGTYFCVAGPGYDGPTGLGTPTGVTPF
jgi:subtilase family serine protease